MNYPTIYRPEGYHQTPINLSFLFFLALTGALMGYCIISLNVDLKADEVFHAPQVWEFYDGRMQIHGSITVPPTYHFVLGSIMRMLGAYSDNLLRLFNMLIGLMLLPVFFKLAARFYPQDAGIRTLQLFFLPMLFPYFFVIYTDVWALLTIACTFLLALNKFYISAALMGALAICVRQDAVIWVGLAYLLICFDNLSLHSTNFIHKLFRQSFLNGFGFTIVFLLFVAFFIINGGVAIGDKNAHKISAFNVSNIHVLLVCAWFLFLPLNIHFAPKIIAKLRSSWTLGLLFISFLIFVGTLKNPHSYNNFGYDYFLHNWLIHTLTQSLWVKCIAFIVSAWMVLTLLVMGLPESRFYWLLVIVPIAVMSHPLIEARYYLPAFLLIQMLRPPLPPNVEYFTLGAYIILSAVLLQNISSGEVFL